MRMRAQERELSERPDAELVEGARSGDATAFEELYRRHADAAWRVGQAVAGNSHDAADAVSEAFTKVFASLPAGSFVDGAQFRAYLLTATRNSAIDALRRSGRTKPTAEVEDRTQHTGPTDVVVNREDNRLVAQAFRDLPERWRSVLWLTEVEGIPAREVGARLGISPNGAAQLAVRARAALRERFLQAHLRADVDRDCRFTVDRLGAYVGGKLPPRDLAKVDQHLAACAPCRERREDLENVGGVLRRIVLPLPLLLGPEVVAKFKTVSAVSAAPATSGATSTAWSDLAAKLQKPLLAASSGVFALGVISASVLGTPDAPLRGAAPAPRLPVVTTTAAEPEVPATPIRIAPAAFEIPLNFDPAAYTSEPPAPTPAPAAPPGAVAATQPPTTLLPADPGNGGGTTAVTPPEAEPLAAAAITLALGPIGAGLSVGAGDGACVGAGVYDAVEAGCMPAAPATMSDDTNDVGVSVVTNGSELGPLDDKSVDLGL